MSDDNGIIRVSPGTTLWKKGQSGNPRGRPALFHEQVRALTSLRKLTPEAVDRLHDMLSDDDGRIVLKACELILKWGLPMTVDAEELTLRHTKQERIEILQEALDKLRAEVAGG